ncbi:MAG: endonuclease domain-containing protein [Sphingobacteriales bacterium JAD_PAG50586_3]|nr:MAG: endonuclease domain-containing protein [Sphingobacteriales bacterium JAD_PAG50586_3]
MDYLESLHRNATPKIIDNANNLRQNMTGAEKHLWSRIRRKQVYGARFRKQHPIDFFILDFYCHELLLGIEVDGVIHASVEAKEYDEGRTFELERYGIRIIRFTNDDVLNKIDDVIKQIENTIAEIKRSTV